MAREQNRTIRSYVRRQGRMTSGQRKALDELWSQYGLDPDKMLDFAEIFERPADTVLEIGFGNGDTLFQIAKHHPEQDFIGIEVHEPGIGQLLANLRETDVSNLRVIKADAVNILHDHIPDESLARVMIFFPDPWPKQRHRKRRLIQQDFVRLFTKKLKKEGVVHCATDWENYAQQMMKVLSNEKQLDNIAGEHEYSDRPDYRPETKFERRGHKLGHGVWDLIFKKP